MTDDQERPILLAGRYVDEAGKPIADLQTAFGTEYKRLPIRMVLQMDTRRLNHLIGELANQPLQVEVQEVRINPVSIGGDIAGRSAHDAGFGGAGFGAAGGAGDVTTLPPNPNLTKVVIQGLIYIFNEPNKTVLQQGEATPSTTVAP